MLGMGGGFLLDIVGSCVFCKLDVLCGTGCVKEGGACAAGGRSCGMRSLKGQSRISHPETMDDSASGVIKDVLLTNQ